MMLPKNAWGFMVAIALATSIFLLSPALKAEEPNAVGDTAGECPWCEALDETDLKYTEIMALIELYSYNAAKFSDSQIFPGQEWTWGEWRGYVTEIGLAKMLVALQDHLIESISENPDSYDAVIELSGRLKLVCDLAVELSIEARDHWLRRRAKSLLRALYFDEENPAAGVFYFLSLESSTKRQGGATAGAEQPAYTEALDYFDLTFKYLGNSPNWRNGIRADVYLEIAKHRAGPAEPADIAYWGGQELRESEYLLALEDLDRAFSWGLLDRKSIREARDLYGRLVGQLMVDLYQKEPEAAVKIANDHLSVEFGWSSKDVHYIYAAQAAEALIPKAAEGSAPTSASAESIRWQKKSLHFGIEAFKLLQDRLAKRLHDFSIDPFAADHGLSLVHYADSDNQCMGTRVWDCQLLDFVTAFLVKDKQYLSELEILSSYKSLLCSECNK